MEQNNRRELETLEVDLDQARLMQRCKSSQAGLRADTLQRHHDLVRELLVGNLPETIDRETLEQIINNLRKKINDLNI